MHSVVIANSQPSTLNGIISTNSGDCRKTFRRKLVLLGDVYNTLFVSGYSLESTRAAL